MNKALMISIQPQHAVNILNGKKTLELRTWIPKDYVGWVYVYVTKGKPFIYYGCHEITEKWSYILSDEYYDDTLNGKVVARFWFDEYETLKSSYYPSMQPVYEMTAETLYLLKLSKSQVNDYGKGKDLYVWHIKKLEVFDEPKQLSEFYKDGSHIPSNDHIMKEFDDMYEDGRLKKAPQKFCYCYVVEE